MKFKIKYKVCENKVDYNVFIKNPSAIFDFVKGDFEDTESVLLIGMDIKNRIIFKKTLAIGAYNQLLITPLQVFKSLMLTPCVNFMLVHNHPSGDKQPSKEDMLFTQKLNKASELIGLGFVDHLIVAGEEFYSFKQAGVL